MTTGLMKIVGTEPCPCGGHGIVVNGVRHNCPRCLDTGRKAIYEPVTNMTIEIRDVD